MIDRSAGVRRVLITGAAGTGGRILAEYLHESVPGLVLDGLNRDPSRPPANPYGGVDYCADLWLAPRADLCRAVQASRPDVVFHVAADVDVPGSFLHPDRTIGNNVIGTVNLLEALRTSGLDPVVVVCSSSGVYGRVAPGDVPIKESCPFRPVSPYGVSKASQDLLGQMYFDAYGTKVVITRAFTYVSPRRTGLFAASFAKQIVEVETGRRRALTHGNLESVRTLMAGKDLAEAYWLAATRCRFGEAYNIGSEVPITVGEVLRWLVCLSGRDVPAELDPALIRPADVTLQIPDVSKFKSETGWAPRVGVDTILLGLLDYWRKKIRE